MKQKNAMTSQQAVTSYRNPDNTEFHGVLNRTTLLYEETPKSTNYSFFLFKLALLKVCFVLKTRHRRSLLSLAARHVYAKFCI